MSSSSSTKSYGGMTGGMWGENTIFEDRKIRGREGERQRERQRDRERRLLHNFYFLPSTLKVMFLSDRLLSEGGKWQIQSKIQQPVFCSESTQCTVQPIKLQTASRHCRNRPPSKHFVLHTKIRYSAEQNTKSAHYSTGRLLLSNEGALKPRCSTGSKICRACWANDKH